MVAEPLAGHPGGCTFSSSCSSGSSGALLLLALAWCFLEPYARLLLALAWCFFEFFARLLGALVRRFFEPYLLVIFLTELYVAPAWTSSWTPTWTSSPTWSSSSTWTSPLPPWTSSWTSSSAWFVDEMKTEDNWGPNMDRRPGDVRGLCHGVPLVHAEPQRK